VLRLLDEMGSEEWLAFVAAEGKEAEWRAALAELRQHVEAGGRHAAAEVAAELVRICRDLERDSHRPDRVPAPDREPAPEPPADAGGWRIDWDTCEGD
jgi:hypothetical protein